MAVVEELIRAEQDGTISFGNYDLAEKTKVSDFPAGGDLYKVKTFSGITKLERNGMFVYESVPGTAVTGLYQDGGRMSFSVEGTAETQITVELEEDTGYQVSINGDDAGTMKTNLGGKLSFSAPLENGAPVKFEIVKCREI